MSTKILIPLHENDVAPRFDLATEVLIVTGIGKAGSGDKRMVVLPRASADQLCHLIITEGIRTVICGGIEDDYYQVVELDNRSWLMQLLQTDASLLKGELTHHFQLTDLDPKLMNQFLYLYPLGMVPVDESLHYFQRWILQGFIQ